MPQNLDQKASASAWTWIIYLHPGPQRRSTNRLPFELFYCLSCSSHQAALKAKRFTKRSHWRLLERFTASLSSCDLLTPGASMGTSSRRTPPGDASTFTPDFHKHTNLKSRALHPRFREDFILNNGVEMLLLLKNCISPILYVTLFHRITPPPSHSHSHSHYTDLSNSVPGLYSGTVSIIYTLWLLSCVEVADSFYTFYSYLFIHFY